MAKKEEEQELIPVGEGVEEEDTQPQPKSQEGKDDDDHDDEDEEEEGKEERLGAGEEDEEDEEKQKRRKEERQTRRQRQKAARDRDRREMDFLRRRNEDLERRFSEVEQRVGHSEVSQVDARIADIDTKIKLADDVLAEAVEKGRGQEYKEALEIRDKLVETRSQLKTYKAMQSRRAETPARPDPRMISHAQDWMRENSWWDPKGGDNDSRTVSRLDAALLNEGYDPTTQDYWDELSDRVREALPHRFESDDDDDDEEGKGKKPAKKNGKGGKGPKFTTGGRERPLKKNEVYISPERKAAMIEAGVWDDPELRQKYLRSYANYDREARSRS